MWSKSNGYLVSGKLTAMGFVFFFHFHCLFSQWTVSYDFTWALFLTLFRDIGLHTYIARSPLLRQDTCLLSVNKQT